MYATNARTPLSREGSLALLVLCGGLVAVLCVLSTLENMFGVTGFLAWTATPGALLGLVLGRNHPPRSQTDRSAALERACIALCYVVGTGLFTMSSATYLNECSIPVARAAVLVHDKAMVGRRRPAPSATVSWKGERRQFRVPRSVFDSLERISQMRFRNRA